MLATLVCRDGCGGGRYEVSTRREKCKGVSVACLALSTTVSSVLQQEKWVTLMD